MNGDPAQGAPAGAGNPLGTAGKAPWIGMCAAGRIIHRSEWPWDAPCRQGAEKVLVVRQDDQDDPSLLIPLCTWHLSLLEEMEGLDLGDVLDPSDPPKDEPS